MDTQTDNAPGSARRNQLLWFAGAVGTTLGVAAWAYSRRELSYWERTKRAAGQVAGQVAETAAEMNPWLGIGASAAVLGCAALVYRIREPKSTWQRASERANELAAQTGKQLRPWLGVITSAAISAAVAPYNAKSPRRATNSVADAADRVADAGSRIWRRLQTVSGEAGKLYPRVRKLIA